MNPDVFRPVSVPGWLRPYARRVLVANCDEPIELPIDVRATGYTYLGWTPRGRWEGVVDGQRVFDTQADGTLHVSGQVLSGEVRVHMSGKLQQVFMELAALGQWELLGVPGADTVDLAADPEQLNPELANALHPLRESRSYRSTTQMCSFFFHCVEPLARRARTTPTYVTHAVDRIEANHGNLRIAELTGESGVSERQLRRKFGQYVGMTPKTFCRTLQVNAALSLLMEGKAQSFSQLATEYGFADQSHMIRAFAERLGMSPKRLLADIEPTLARFVGESRKSGRDEE